MDRVATVHNMQRVFERERGLTDLTRFHPDSPYNIGTIAKAQSAGLHIVLWSRGSSVHSLLTPISLEASVSGSNPPIVPKQMADHGMPREGHNGGEFQYCPACYQRAEFKPATLMRLHSHNPGVSRGSVSLGASFILETVLFQNEWQRHLVPLPYCQKRGIISFEGVAETLVWPPFPIAPPGVTHPLSSCFELTACFEAGMGTVLPNNGYDHNNSHNFLCQCDVELSQTSVSDKNVSLKPVTRLYRPLSGMKTKPQ
jgi:hypothetical protein